MYQNQRPHGLTSSVHTKGAGLGLGLGWGFGVGGELFLRKRLPGRGSAEVQWRSGCSGAGSLTSSPQIPAAPAQLGPIPPSSSPSHLEQAHHHLRCTSFGHPPLRFRTFLLDWGWGRGLLTSRYFSHAKQATGRDLTVWHHCRIMQHRLLLGSIYLCSYLDLHSLFEKFLAFPFC